MKKIRFISVNDAGKTREVATAEIVDGFIEMSGPQEETAWSVVEFYARQMVDFRIEDGEPDPTAEEVLKEVVDRTTISTRFWAEEVK